MLILLSYVLSANFCQHPCEGKQQQKTCYIGNKSGVIKTSPAMAISNASSNSSRHPSFPHGFLDTEQSPQPLHLAGRPQDSGKYHQQNRCDGTKILTKFDQQIDLHQWNQGESKEKFRSILVKDFSDQMSSLCRAHPLSPVEITELAHQQAILGLLEKEALNESPDLGKFSFHRNGKFLFLD